MAQSAAQSVDEYIGELATDRQKAIATVREVILDHLPEGFEENMQYGMISYVIPLEKYPMTYNRQPLMYAALASQKTYMSLYLMNIYGDKEVETWFIDRYGSSGKKLDMGKSCVRFKRLDDLPLGLIGEAIARTPVACFIQRYEASRRKPESVRG